MPTFNTGKLQGTSAEEPLDGMQIYKNMTMKSNMYQKKQTSQQMSCHAHQEQTKEKATTRKSRS
jgi:hypothetical protein